MSRGRAREFWCEVVSETVLIRLKRNGGFGRAQGYFVQCNQTDCQYVEENKPPCPLHDVTLTQALQSGKPVAYLIGTPAFCQTGVCAPILDNLITAHNRLGDKVTMVHAEVYTDNTATTTTPAVQAYQMSFEPCLWITDATGTVVERLDFVFDQGEIDAALAKVAS